MSDQPTPPDRRNSRTVLLVLAPFVLVFGLLAAAIVWIILGTLTVCEGPDCTGAGFILLGLVPLAGLVGVAGIPFFIWYLVAHSKETAYARTGSPAPIATDPPAASARSWRSPNPWVLAAALTVWYATLVTAVYVLQYRYAWLQENSNNTGGGDTGDTLPMLSLIPWLISPAWVFVLRRPRRPAARAAIASTMSVLILPPLMLTAASHGYDAGRDAWRTEGNWQQSLTLDDIIDPSNPDTWDDPLPDPNAEPSGTPTYGSLADALDSIAGDPTASFSAEPVPTSTCPPVTTDTPPTPAPPSPPAFDFNGGQSGEQTPQVLINIETCENFPVAAANTGDLIRLDGWGWGNKLSYTITPSEGVGYAGGESPGLTYPDGRLWWRPCAPGTYTWTMGNDTGTVYVDGPDYCGQPMDLFHDPRTPARPSIDQAVEIAKGDLSWTGPSGTLLHITVDHQHGYIVRNDDPTLDVDDTGGGAFYVFVSAPGTHELPVLLFGNGGSSSDTTIKYTLTAR